MAEVCFGSVVNGDQGKVPREFIIKALKCLEDKHSQRVLIQYGGINRSSIISFKDKNSEMILTQCRAVPGVSAPKVDAAKVLHASKLAICLPNTRRTHIQFLEYM